VDSGQLNYKVSNISGNWISDGAGSLSSQIGGKTQLQSLFAQDTWNFAPRWKAVLGLRAEQWSASDGYTAYGTAGSGSTGNKSYDRRDEFYLSPKAALSHQVAADTIYKASVGRAVRMPTLSELYGATSTTSSQYINDPNLKAEDSLTTEFSREKDLGNGLLRLTLFAEETKNSIYSQSTTVENGSILSRVTNVDRILTKGLELVYMGMDVATRGLDVSTSVTYANSIIIDNTGYVTTAGDTIGKWQPNIPQWRATALANYRVDEQWNVAAGARYSGPQYRTLNNADINGFTYQGVSEFFTTDLRVRYKVDKHWVASFGIDNLNNYQYWNFHPYPQRNYNFELKWVH
jgi:iron complex outermembrane receptor protein